MNIIVVGIGKIGSALAQHLSAEKHDVTIIDTDPQVVNDCSDMYDIMGICGNGASQEVLLEAGVSKANLLIAATNLDEFNILCCLVAKKLGVKNTVARVRNPEYNSQLSLLRDDLGLSMSINPDSAAADELFRILKFPAALKIEPFSNRRAEIVEIRLSENTPLNGMTLKELTQKYSKGYKVLICAVRRGDEVVIPKGDFRIKSGDMLSIISTSADIEHFFRSIGIIQKEVRSVIIIGASRTTYYLARSLIASGVSVKIIDSNRDRCLDICEKLPQATVIHGDGTSQELLAEEGVERYDAFIALTGIDETNIIVSLYASSLGIDKVITKVNQDSLINIAEKTQLDTIVSPKNIIANLMVRYARAMQNSLGSNIETLYKIVGNRVEALEFRVDDTFGFIGVPLKDLQLRPEVLIAAIIRSHQTIIPGGDDVIRPGDNVIVVTKTHQLFDLSDILVI